MPWHVHGMQRPQRHRLHGMRPHRDGRLPIREGPAGLPQGRSVYGRLRGMEAGGDEAAVSRQMQDLLAQHDQDVSVLNMIHRLIFCEDQLRPIPNG